MLSLSSVPSLSFVSSQLAQNFNSCFIVSLSRQIERLELNAKTNPIRSLYRSKRDINGASKAWADSNIYFVNVCYIYLMYQMSNKFFEEVKI